MKAVSWTLGLALALSLVIAAPMPADALYRANGLDIGGHIRTTNVIRHQDIDNLAFIMQRNTLKLRLEYKWLQRGKAFGKYNVPFLKRSDIYMLYRGMYDSIYDTRPGQLERKDFQGDPLTPQDVSLDSLSADERDSFKFNNNIREAYIDLYFKHIPLTLRIGKQQIVWGETDGFRMLDRANTLDLSWHFFQELPPPGFGFDEIRQPFFMVKGLYDLKKVGPLSQTFIEAYWNPGFDWNPGKVGFLPRPWGAKILNPLENSKGSGAFQSSFCRNAKDGTCSGLLNGTQFLNQGNYAKNIADNSQFGIRFHFLAGSTEWTINYLYQRFSPDGSPIAFVRGVPQNQTFDVTFDNGSERTFNAQQWCEGRALDPNDPGVAAAVPWAAGELCAEYFTPYVHTVGFSFNWFEGVYTQTVWRVESVIDFDLPFYDGDKQNALFNRPDNGPILLPGITSKNMWKGMIAFDRPTWIKWLNKKTTFFLSGQMFWHYIIEHERRRCAIGDDPANGYTNDPGENCGDDNGNFLLPGEQTGLIGGLDLPKLDSPNGKGRDTIHQWEILTTFAAIGFYKGGTLVPAFIYIMDPVNSYSQEVAIGVDWFITPNVALNITTRLIWVGYPWDPYQGHKNDSDIDGGELFEPWFLGGGSRGRSETSFQATWQF